MDLFSVGFLAFTAMFLGGAIVIGLAALLRVRRARIERSSMRQHLRSLDPANRLSDQGAR